VEPDDEGSRVKLDGMDVGEREGEGEGRTVLGMEEVEGWEGVIGSDSGSCAEGG
jgi:hypothetical protein